MPDNNAPANYKTVVLVGDEQNSVQVVVDENTDELELVVQTEKGWEIKLYKQDKLNTTQFLLTNAEKLAAEKF